MSKFSVSSWSDLGHANRGLPNYVVLPNWLGALQDKRQYQRPGEYAGWPGHDYDPLTTHIPKKDANGNPDWRDCSDES